MTAAYEVGAHAAHMIEIAIREEESSILADVRGYEAHERARGLGQIAYSNRSEWSGGPYSQQNIREAILREAAIRLLSEPHRWSGD